MNEPALKACRRCGIRKLLDVFCVSARNKDGRGSYCRTCDQARGDARLDARAVVRPGSRSRMALLVAEINKFDVRCALPPPQDGGNARVLD